jgi:uncharacterized protein YndB with AHSA1/START domain
MTERNVTHGTFVVERRLKASPDRVFNAFANKDEKAKWFVGPAEWQSEPGVFDFRVDGEETNHGGVKGKFWSEFWCRYQDIVPNERIVYVYRMAINGVPMSASLAVLELKPDGAGTHLVLTETGAYFDGFSTQDNLDGREHGTNVILDQLVASLGG